MNYYLGPYQWVNNSWQPPVGTIAAIDLRNLSQMGTPVVQDGLGFFVTTGLVDGDLLGSGDLREINTTGLMKSTWNSLLGYNPNGDRLVDLLYDHLTMGSDPTGAVASKPLLPADGHLALHLGSRVKSTQFRIGHSPESNRVISVLQNDYRQIRDEVLAEKLPADSHRKVLGFWANQFKVDSDIFIPNDLPKETSISPASTFSENFDGADNAALGKQLTWVEGGATTTWENQGNAAQRPNIGDQGDPVIYRTARCTSALSSADHECEAIITTYGAAGAKNVQAGPAVRYSSSADTLYYGRGSQTSGTGDGPSAILHIDKIVTGTLTGGPSSSRSDSIPLTIKLKIIGSSLTLFAAGVSQVTWSDSSITGNLFGGLYGLNVSGTADLALDDWSLTDEFPPPPQVDVGAGLLI